MYNDVSSNEPNLLYNHLKPSIYQEIFLCSLVYRALFTRVCSNTIWRQQNRVSELIFFMSIEEETKRNPVSFEASNSFSEVIDCEEYSIASMLQEEIGTTPEYPKWPDTHNKNTRSTPALRYDHTMASSSETVSRHTLTLDQNQCLGALPDFRYTFKVETDRFLPGMSGIGSNIAFPDSVYCGCDDILTLDCLHHGSMHDMEMQIEQILTPNM